MNYKINLLPSEYIERISKRNKLLGVQKGLLVFLFVAIVICCGASLANFTTLGKIGSQKKEIARLQNQITSYDSYKELYNQLKDYKQNISDIYEKDKNYISQISKIAGALPADIWIENMEFSTEDNTCQILCGGNVYGDASRAVNALSQLEIVKNAACNETNSTNGKVRFSVLLQLAEEG